MGVGAVIQIMGALAAWALLTVAAIVTVAAFAGVMAQRWARGLWRGSALAWALAGAAVALGALAWATCVCARVTGRLALLVGRLGRRAAGASAGVYARGCPLSRPNEHGGPSLRSMGGQPALAPGWPGTGGRPDAPAGRWPAPRRWNTPACRRHAMAPVRCLGRARLRWWKCRRCALCGEWEHRRTCPWREAP